MKNKDFSQITETPGTKVTQEQVLRVYQRYFFAKKYCEGKDVLEAACGSGVGLGILSDVANSVSGIDFEPKNLAQAKSTYKGIDGIYLEEGDAQNLQFEDKSLDVVILYEAIYYLPNPEKFLAECRRVLRPGGMVIIGSANKEWNDFNPSLYSTRYFAASELKSFMEEAGFSTELYQGFPISNNGPSSSKLLSLIKRTAVKLKLIPKSMKYKKFLKRIFVGKLVPLPHRIRRDTAEYISPQPLDLNRNDGQFKVIYAVGRL